MKRFLFVLVLSALAFGAEAAEVRGYGYWSISSYVMKNGYVKDENPKATPVAMEKLTLYFIPYSTTIADSVAPNYYANQTALLEALRTVGTTVSDIKASALSTANTQAASTLYPGTMRGWYSYLNCMMKGTTTAQLTMTGYLVAFSSDDKYIYFSGAYSKLLGTAPNGNMFDTINVSTSSNFQEGETYVGAGWYAVPKVLVSPASVDNVSVSIYEDEVEVAGDPVKVKALANVKIVYTAADGYLFGNGEKTITHELVASSNPTVDTLEQTVYETQTVPVSGGGSIALSKDWVVDKTGKTDPDEQAAVLNTSQDNGLTLMENEILNLDGADPDDIPVCVPVQSADASKITFALENVTVDDTSCAKVTYRVVPSEGEPSKSVGPDETVPMALPETGVRYYKIEVDVGATK